jgi:hypothetical protein
MLQEAHELLGFICNVTAIGDCSYHIIVAGDSFDELIIIKSPALESPTYTVVQIGDVHKKGYVSHCHSVV